MMKSQPQSQGGTVPAAQVPPDDGPGEAQEPGGGGGGLKVCTLQPVRGTNRSAVQGEIGNHLVRKT